MTGEEWKLKDQVESCAKHSRQGNVGTQNRMEGKVVEGTRLQGKESLQWSLLVGIRMRETCPGIGTVPQKRESLFPERETGQGQLREETMNLVWDTLRSMSITVDLPG